MIVSFRHKGLERFFRTGSKSGINAAFAPRLQLQLGALDAANSPKQMDVPGWGLHPLQGRLAGHWAVKVNANWRMTFQFRGEHAEVVDLQDYH
jgi:proteic killer suppression protein